MRSILQKTLLFLLIACAFSCGKRSTHYLRIAIDPNWYPMDVKGREKALVGFSNDLLMEISKRQNLPLAILFMNTENLLWGLDEGKYDAILSSIRPYPFNEDRFDFSELYLKTGPVLIVAEQFAFTSLEALKNKEIAIPTGSTDALFLKKNPAILIRSYDSIPTALNAIVAGHLDGAFVDVLAAVAYCKDLYRNQLKIVTPPLTDDGLRLIALANHSPELIEGFNRGLDELMKKGIYAELAGKWGLPY